MRNEVDGFKKYDCPDVAPDKKMFERFNKAIAPA